MDKAWLDVGKLPKKTAEQIARLNLGESVMVDSIIDPSTVFSTDKDGWTFPTILLADGKSYVVEQNPPKHQDASDLVEYQEIIVKAKNFSEKSRATCDAIISINDSATFLTCLNITDVGEDEATIARVRNRRGRIQNSKLTAVRIWREGKLVKESDVNPS